jgi:hypothetical protein
MQTFLAAFCLPIAVCLAQSPVPAPQVAGANQPGANQQGAVIHYFPNPGAMNVTYRAGEFGFDGKVVTGVPYTAQAVTTITQTLADGNRITNTNTAQVARDSMGRTRREQTLPGFPGSPAGASKKLVFINDPVAQVNYVLEPGHIARKMPKPQVIQFQAGPAPGAAAASAQSSDHIVGVLPPEPSAAMAMPLQVALSAPDRGADFPTNTESLGSQVIEGVQADGTRTTTTIPAGKIGNERPIVITYERWYSSDLHAVVKTKQSDPRFGETTYELINIQRIEPPASLFQVPPDDKIVSPTDTIKQIVIEK